MQDSREYSVYPSDLNILGCFINLRKYLENSSLVESSISDREISYGIKIDDTRRLYAENYNDFIINLEEHPHSFPINIHSHWIKNKELICIKMEIYRSNIEVSIYSKDSHVISALHDKIKDIFKASNPLVDRSTRVTRSSLKKSVFIAHRFDECGNKLAAILSTFLRRLGFDILEGTGYEARDIPSKVAEKINSQDIFICLVTPGDGSWILSEISYARGIKKYIIILCQENIEFKSGIVGSDYEYISFPENNLEKCFSDLLYALPT
ncbi:MAG: hypothetical protein ACLPYB_12815 [Desulfobaccales bacterium]